MTTIAEVPAWLGQLGSIGQTWLLMGSAFCLAAGLFLLVQSSWRDRRPRSQVVSRSERNIRVSLQQAGYEMLSLSRGYYVTPRAMGEFGFFPECEPGHIRRVRVRTPNGAIREGWLLADTKLTFQPDCSAVPQQSPAHLCVAWDS
jgi:hypothetical protein